MTFPFKHRKVLDNLIHPLHDSVFENTNCLECANCCKTTGPLFTNKDINRISYDYAQTFYDFMMSGGGIKEAQKAFAGKNVCQKTFAKKLLPGKTFAGENVCRKTRLPKNVLAPVEGC